MSCSSIRRWSFVAAEGDLRLFFYNHGEKNGFTRSQEVFHFLKSKFICIDCSNWMFSDWDLRHSHWHYTREIALKNGVCFEIIAKFDNILSFICFGETTHIHSFSLLCFPTQKNWHRKLWIPIIMWHDQGVWVGCR